MQFYNTLTRKKEEFVPIEPGKVKMYACGPTVYNYFHVGNARCFVVFDMLRRYLEYRGYDVTFVQNFTDIDDKVIRRANEEGVTYDVIAKRYIDEYFIDAKGLGVRPADVHPLATDNIDTILCIVKTLVDKGYAYAVDGDVYFRTTKFKEYGKLSHMPIEDLEAGARIDVSSQKEDPLDFALWKGAKPGEPSWDSPWGKGRPGWHIECSTMSLKYLGEKFDFHGGGSDLIFPHHENEIAQSQACIGDDHSFAQYWLHNGFITIHNEKMSKSKNNFFTVKDILKEYPGEVIRFFILQTHYRSPLDFSDERLKEAQTSLARLQNTKAYVDELCAKQGTADTAAELASKAEALRKEFYEAMDDDFNTALAISQMFALSKEINIYYQEVTNGTKAFDAAGFKTVAAIYAEMAEIIGIFEQQEKAEDDGLTDKLMEIIITLRQDARKEKNWAVADKIRDALKDADVVLEDTPNGVRWKKA